MAPNDISADLLEGIGVLVAVATFVTGFQSVRLGAEFVRLLTSGEHLEARLEERANAGSKLTNGDIIRARDIGRQLQVELGAHAVSRLISLVNVLALISTLVAAGMAINELDHFDLFSLTINETLLFGMISVHITVFALAVLERRRYLRRVRLLVKPSSIQRNPSHEAESTDRPLAAIVSTAISDAYLNSAPHSPRSEAIEELRRRFKTWPSPHIWAAELERRYGASSWNEDAFEALNAYRDTADLDIEDDQVRSWRVIAGALGACWGTPWKAKLQAGGGIAPEFSPLQELGSDRTYGEQADAFSALYIAHQVPEMGFVYSPGWHTERDSHLYTIEWLNPANRLHAIVRVSLAHLLIADRSLLRTPAEPERSQHLAHAAALLAASIATDGGGNDSYVLSAAAVVALARGRTDEAIRFAERCRIVDQQPSNLISPGEPATTCVEEAALAAVGAYLLQNRVPPEEWLEIYVHHDPRWIERSDDQSPEVVEHLENESDDDWLARYAYEQYQSIENVNIQRYPMRSIRAALKEISELQTTGPSMTNQDLGGVCLWFAELLHQERVLERLYRWSPLFNTPGVTVADVRRHIERGELETLLSMGI